MSFRDALDAHYPTALGIDDFVTRSTRALRARGFSEHNAILCPALCRDELVRPLADALHAAWGERTFSLSSLAGLPLLGPTGLQAGLDHAPLRDGRPRYLLFALPHIGIGPDGAVGQCQREGRDDRSPTCGALAALLAERDRGAPLETAFDPDDPEYSLLRARLAGALDRVAAGDLVALTEVARRAITTDLEALLERLVDPSRADYALVSGTLIHGPGGRHFVAPAEAYAVVDGDRRALAME